MKIDRAIEIFDTEHRENYDGMDEVNEACWMGMEALERTRWIPCSKKLPLDGENVLLWDAIEGDVFTGALLGGVFWVDGFEDKDFVWNITHWMPLPEPPKEGGNENAAD